ncbi:Ulp1 protease [Aphelenchoides besseyi]|nr:Ulp1 protease [Aphelenchoides besseyi]
MDHSGMLDVRLLAEISDHQSTQLTSDSIEVVNESFDLDALDMYMKLVSAQNKNTCYELPRNDLNDSLAEARNNLAATRAEATCVRREFSAARNYVRALRVDQELRDRQLQNIFKASERRKKWKEFDIRQDARLKYARVCQEEGRLRHAARLNQEIESEKEYRRRLGLPVFVPLFFQIEEELFPELDAEAIELVKRAWNKRAPEDEVFSEDFAVKITRKDLRTLAGLNWLNDEIINFYLNLIVRRGEQNADLPKTYAFNTFFLSTLQQRGYAAVKRWTRKVDVFSYDVLLVPVHLGNHWCLAVIDFKAQEISYFDSLGGKNVGCLEALKSYLQEEHRDKKKSEIDLSNWNFECKAEIPRQMNGSDCGVFTCVFAEFSSRRYELKFDQRIMPYYRQRMVYEICNRTLMI